MQNLFTNRWTIRVAAIGLSVSCIGASDCWVKGSDAVCTGAGALVWVEEVPCLSADGEWPSSGIAYETTDDPAYKATVKPLASPSIWGHQGKKSTTTFTSVGTTLYYPDPDDCEEVLEEPGEGWIMSCQGERVDAFSGVCYN